MEMPKQIDGIPVFEFLIDEKETEFGLQFMSFVDQPAMEKTFIALSKYRKDVKLSINEDKRLVTGVALRANFPIYREKNGKPYYFYVTEHELEKMVDKFMREKRTDMVNLSHDKNQKVDGVFLRESFFLNDSHKLSYPAFNDIENGSWMVTYKVENDSVWNDIKSGKFRGFSVEMTGDMQGFNLNKETNKDIDELITLISVIYG